MASLSAALLTVPGDSGGRVNAVFATCLFALAFCRQICGCPCHCLWSSTRPFSAGRRASSHWRLFTACGHVFDILGSPAFTAHYRPDFNVKGGKGRAWLITGYFVTINRLHEKTNPPLHWLPLHLSLFDHH